MMKNIMKRWGAWLLLAVMTIFLCSGTALAAGKSGSSSKTQTKVTDGWEEKKGDYYYYLNGEKVKGWQTANGEWYYFQPSSGKLQTGWANVDGKKYHFDQDGTMDWGWTELTDKWYCFGYDGAMLTDWVSIGGTYYYFDENGVMQTSWLEDDNAWYYLKDTGALKTGWLKDNGVWYYFRDNGKMARNETITGGGKKYTFASWGGLTATEAVETPKPAESSSSADSYTVYVSKNGKIHRYSDCSGMKYYTTMSYSQAIAQGYDLCKKCYK